MWNRSGTALACVTLTALLVRTYSLDGPGFWLIHRLAPRIERREIRTWLAQHLTRQSVRGFQAVLVGRAAVSQSLPPL